MHNPRIAQQNILRNPRIVQQKILHNPRIAQQSVLHNPRIAQQSILCNPRIVQQNILHNPRIAQQCFAPRIVQNILHNSMFVYLYFLVLPWLPHYIITDKKTQGPCVCFTATFSCVHDE